MIGKSDVFVFLDDVQFSYRSWQQRNRILIEGKEKWLTIPVIKGGTRSKIENILIDESQDWRNKHLNVLKTAYRGSKYYNYYMSFFEELLYYETNKLNLFNQFIIKSISLHLGLKVRFLRSSPLKSTGIKSEKLYNICSALGATKYLSALGSKAYIDEEGVFSNNKLQVIFNSYKVAAYRQSDTSSFVSNLSIADFLFNCGLERTSIHFSNER